MDVFEAFNKLSLIFKEHDHSLYFVGGAVRDYLLRKEITDIDITSDATPDDVLECGLENVDDTFKKYGNLIISFVGYKFELTTLRKEKGYKDNRHPNEVVFTKSLIEDSYRRDFTINALYMDEVKNIYDFHGGVSDLNQRLIRMIGDPDVRIKEDPLRILRALRLSLTLSFKIDEDLKKAIIANKELLNKLNPQKVKQELKKINLPKENIFPLFDDFGISYLLDMLK